MSTDRENNISITVVYADSSECQLEKKLELKSPVTVKEAIIQSGVTAVYSSLDLNTCDVGIYSKRVSMGHLLNDQDRVEIYRPLTINPKDARRLRAKQKKA